MKTQNSKSNLIAFDFHIRKYTMDGYSLIVHLPPFYLYCSFEEFGLVMMCAPAYSLISMSNTLLCVLAIHYYYI